jgi:hypothetical protein
MGAWGTGISSNDTYADVYDDFIDLYNEGMSVPEITKKLISENQETINTNEDAPNFWFALANAQWECKALNPEIFQKVSDIITSNQDIEIWKELGASTSDLKSREKHLKKFLDKIKIERPKARQKKKKKFYDSIFKKGDCLIYIMDNDNYGGAFVLTDESQTEVGINQIAITTINKKEKPTLEDFKDAEVYIKRLKGSILKNNKLIDEWRDQPQIGGFYGPLFKNHDVNIEVLGQLPLYKEYGSNSNTQIGFGWIVLKSAIPLRTEYEKLNGVAKSKLKISEWTKKRWPWHRP